MTYDSSNPSWWLPLAIHYHYGNGTVASCVLGSGVEAVLLTGDKRLVMGDYGFSGLFFFSRGEKLGTHASLLPTAISEVGCNPEEHTRPDGLNALASLWEETKMRLETLQPGWESTRRQKARGRGKPCANFINTVFHGDSSSMPASLLCCLLPKLLLYCISKSYLQNPSSLPLPDPVLITSLSSSLVFCPFLLLFLHMTPSLLWLPAFSHLPFHIWWMMLARLTGKGTRPSIPTSYHYRQDNWLPKWFQELPKAIPRSPGRLSSKAKASEFPAQRFFQHKGLLGHISSLLLRLMFCHTEV